MNRRGHSSKLSRQLEALEDRCVPAFLAPASYAAGGNPAGIAVGDFNHDGRDDLAVTSQALTALVCLVFVGLCVNSFVQARLLRKGQAGAAGPGPTV